MVENKREGHENNLPDDLSRPAQQALAAAGYTRLEQLARVSEDDILALHGIGPKTIPQLRSALAEIGLSFTGDESAS